MHLTEAQISRYQTLGEQIETLKEEREGILAAIRASIDPGKDAVVGDYEVKVGKPTERINLAKVAKSYTVVDRPELYKMQVDTARVREHFSPAQLVAEDLLVSSPGRITIK